MEPHRGAAAAAAAAPMPPPLWLHSMQTATSSTRSGGGIARPAPAPPSVAAASTAKRTLVLRPIPKARGPPSKGTGARKTGASCRVSLGGVAASPATCRATGLPGQGMAEPAVPVAKKPYVTCQWLIGSFDPEQVPRWMSVEAPAERATALPEELKPQLARATQLVRRAVARPRRPQRTLASSSMCTPRAVELQEAFRAAEDVSRWVWASVVERIARLAPGTTPRNSDLAPAAAEARLDVSPVVVPSLAAMCVAAVVEVQTVSPVSHESGRRGGSTSSRATLPHVTVRGDDAVELQHLVRGLLEPLVDLVQLKVEHLGAVTGGSRDPQTASDARLEASTWLGELLRLHLLAEAAVSRGHRAEEPARLAALCGAVVKHGVAHSVLVGKWAAGRAGPAGPAGADGEAVRTARRVVDELLWLRAHPRGARDAWDRCTGLSALLPAAWFSLGCRLAEQQERYVANSCFDDSGERAQLCFAEALHVARELLGDGHALTRQVAEVLRRHAGAATVVPPPARRSPGPADTARSVAATMPARPLSPRPLEPVSGRTASDARQSTSLRLPPAPPASWGAPVTPQLVSVAPLVVSAAAAAAESPLSPPGRVPAVAPPVHHLLRPTAAVVAASPRRVTPPLSTLACVSSSSLSSGLAVAVAETASPSPMRIPWSPGVPLASRSGVVAEATDPLGPPTELSACRLSPLRDLSSRRLVLPPALAVPMMAAVTTDQTAPSAAAAAAVVVVAPAAPGDAVRCEVGRQLVSGGDEAARDAQLATPSRVESILMPTTGPRPARNPRVVRYHFDRLDGGDDDDGGDRRGPTKLSVSVPSRRRSVSSRSGHATTGLTLGGRLRLNLLDRSGAGMSPRVDADSALGSHDEEDTEAGADSVEKRQHQFERALYMRLRETYDRRVQAALVIQKLWRGFCTRLEFYNIRRLQQYHTFTVQKAAALVVSRFMRARLDRRYYAAAKLAVAASVEARVRHEVQVLRSIRCIERSWRASMARRREWMRREAARVEREKQQHALRVRAAVLLQRWWRIAPREKRYWQRRNEEIREATARRRQEAQRVAAAVTIQRYTRGRQTRAFVCRFRVQLLQDRLRRQRLLHQYTDAVRCVLLEYRNAMERQRRGSSPPGSPGAGPPRHGESVSGPLPGVSLDNLRQRAAKNTAERFRQLTDAARRVQLWFRRRLARRERVYLSTVRHATNVARQELEAERYTAAVRLQAVSRMYLTRRVCQRLWAEHGRNAYRALLHLQRVVRGYGLRRVCGAAAAWVSAEAARARAAQERRQRHAHGVVTAVLRSRQAEAVVLGRRRRKEREDAYLRHAVAAALEEDAAATVIQRAYRDRRARLQREQQRQADLRRQQLLDSSAGHIQRLFRGFLARRRAALRRAHLARVSAQRVAVEERLAEHWALDCVALQRWMEVSRAGLMQQERHQWQRIIHRAAPSHVGRRERGIHSDAVGEADDGDDEESCASSGGSIYDE